ncbi:hypothetical protein EVAR_38710_1 [Eumeta japonica]|uniref:Uncharacterized protein n=1 Tax=Eumeta variegata TaxID=151549 RepID=A0A4C1XM62_EUMVA|nr:hypothetical protein EVAR_38710_1 [Eumeta japonica]
MWYKFTVATCRCTTLNETRKRRENHGYFDLLVVRKQHAKSDQALHVYIDILGADKQASCRNKISSREKIRLREEREWSGQLELSLTRRNVTAETAPSRGYSQERDRNLKIHMRESRLKLGQLKKNRVGIEYENGNANGKGIETELQSRSRSGLRLERRRATGLNSQAPS